MGLVLVALAGIVLAWLTFVVVLAVARPRELSVAEVIGLLPDAVRLVRRLATDKQVPLGARLSVWFLLTYLAMPFDLVPDFIPVLGQADDVILIAVVLRRLVRSAGPATLARHWPGDPDGLATLKVLLRVE